MNSLCKHHIDRFYQQYKSRAFDQDDVALFLVLVRDYTNANTIFRELGDFLAHPKCKEKGLVLKDFEPIVDFFEENIDEIFTDLDIKNPPYKGLGTLDEIVRDLTNTLKIAGLKVSLINKQDLAFRDFVFCLVFLLNNFKLKIDKRLFQMEVSYGHSLELKIEYESKKRKNNFASLSIITLGNVWTSNVSNTKFKPTEYIARRFNNGLLGAIPYSLDSLSLSSDMGSLPKNTVFPLPEFVRKPANMAIKSDA